MVSGFSLAPEVPADGGGGAGVAGADPPMPGDKPAATPGFEGCQVWSFTQFYSVDFSQSRIGVKKVCF